VEQTALSQLAAWESFYVITGSSAAALIGLQFVVVVLAAEVNAGSERTTRAFGTPTIVHFCGVLLISATMSAPWHALSSSAVVLGPCGVAGVIYGVIVVRHARRQTDYAPVLEDWLWHGAFPVVAYATVLTGALGLGRHPVSSLFVIAAGAVLLLFVGIHNAWDAVTYIAHNRPRSQDRRGGEG
jgi:hypothetical protein